MLTKEQKKQLVKDLRKKLKNSKLAVFCNFEKIPVSRQGQLKKEFQKIGGEVFVTKRRLLQRALVEEGIRFPEIIGPVMMSLAPDEISPAKTFKRFPKKKEKIEFIGGVLKEENKYTVLNRKELEEIAILPAREEILAKFIGVLEGSISNLCFVLRGNIQKLNYILANIREE